MSDTPNLATALVAAQKDMPKVEPDAVNPHFKSKFVSLDHLIAKTRPVLQKHGLTIVQEPTYERFLHGGGGELAYDRAALKTTLMHVSGEQVSSVMPLLLGKNDMQGLGAAITYARRYAWAALLGISEQEDDDGNAASAPAKPAEGSAVTARKAPAPRAATATDPAAAAPPSPDALFEEFKSLAAALKKIDPEFEDAEAVMSAEEKWHRGDAGWLGRAGKRLKERIAQASSTAEQFPIPERGKTKAAA